METIVGFPAGEGPANNLPSHGTLQTIQVKRQYTGSGTVFSSSWAFKPCYLAVTATPDDNDDDDDYVNNDKLFSKLTSILNVLWAWLMRCSRGTSLATMLNTLELMISRSRSFPVPFCCKSTCSRASFSRSDTEPSLFGNSTSSLSSLNWLATQIHLNCLLFSSWSIGIVSIW